MIPDFSPPFGPARALSILFSSPRSSVGDLEKNMRRDGVPEAVCCQRSKRHLLLFEFWPRRKRLSWACYTCVSCIRRCN